MHKNQKIYRLCHKKCEECSSSKWLVVHHIDHNRKNNTFENFIVLCESCHSLVHRRIKNIKKMRPYYITDINQLTFKFYKNYFKSC